MTKARGMSCTTLLCWLAACFAHTTQAADSQRPPVSMADTLAFREIQSVHMAPLAEEVAYVVRRASLQRKKNEDSLMIIGARGGTSRTLLTTDRIQRVAWDRSGRNLYALIEREMLRVLTRIDASSGTLEELWTTQEPVDHFAISPDGTLALVSTLVKSDPAVVQRRIESGFVYDYDRNTVLDLLNRDYADVEAVQIQVLDILGKGARHLTQMPFLGVEHLGYVRSMTISPDNRKAALIVGRRGEPGKGGAGFNYDLVVLDLQTGRCEEPVPDQVLTTERAPAWLGDSKRLFFVSNGQAKLYESERNALGTLEWAGKLPDFLAAEASAYDEARARIYVPSSQGLYELSLRDKTSKQTQGRFDEVSFSKDFDAYAFVSQSSNEWPEVAIHDFKMSQSRRLTAENSYLAQHALGSVEPLTVKNSGGAESKAYLLYPVGYEQGRRYPLIVATYGFQGKFPITAEWHSSFPAQTLAGKGYAVLMLNRPGPIGQNLAGDPVKAREQEGWQMLSTFENAVNLMIERGIADPERMGIYGWSHGGFIVEFLLAHSKLRFAAAALGEGGDYKPGGYWFLGGQAWPRIYDNIYGGPMSKKTIDAYLEFSPGLRYEHFQSPLLLEFATVGGYGLETYVHLRELGKPAELVIYDGEEHNFVRPTARFASMHRKVDWFDYWLLNRRDPDPAKLQQYSRWDAMATEWGRRRSGARPPTPSVATPASDGQGRPMP